MVPCAHGVHLRVASRIVTLAQGLQSDIWLSSNARSANAKSILGMLELGAAQGTPLTITARGPDAKRAVEAIERLFNSVRPCA